MLVLSRRNARRIETAVNTAESGASDYVIGVLGVRAAQECERFVSLRGVPSQQHIAVRWSPCAGLAPVGAIVTTATLQRHADAWYLVSVQREPATSKRVELL